MATLVPTSTGDATASSFTYTTVGAASTDTVRFLPTLATLTNITRERPRLWPPRPRDGYRSSPGTVEYPSSTPRVLRAQSPAEAAASPAAPLVGQPQPNRRPAARGRWEHHVAHRRPS